MQSITLEADTVTGVTLVSVDLLDDQDDLQTVRLSLETAIALGIVLLSGDGKPMVNETALGQTLEIDPAVTISHRQKSQHPVGGALATFFSGIDGLDYETIMLAHAQGTGFGVIAQALWLTSRLEGNAEVFAALLTARATGDYSAFVFENGSSPENWGQLRNAILGRDKKNNLGVVISGSGETDREKGKDKDKESNGNHPDKNKDKEKDKKDKDKKDKDQTDKDKKK